MSSRAAIVVGSFILGSGLVIQSARSAAPARKPAAGTKGAAAKVDFQRGVLPVLQKYCGGCHGEKQEIAGISFAKYATEASLQKDRMVWEKVHENLHSGHMPPKSAPQPSTAERTRVVAFLKDRLFNANCDVRDPGRVTMRRLNREEYNNTVRDLLGVKLRPADDFPSDDVGYGFDNIGDVLTISPILMEKYLAAAEKLAKAAIQTPEDAPRPVQRYEAEQLPTTGGKPYQRYAVVLPATGNEVSAEHNFPANGLYMIRVRGFGQQAGPEPAKLIFRLDGKDVRTQEVSVNERDITTYETGVRVTPGKHTVSLAFANDFYDPNIPNERRRDRNLAIDWVEVVGPTDGPMPEPPESHRRIVFVQPEKGKELAAARQILERFAKRAYRRPATKEEVERLLNVFQLVQGESFERGIRLAVQAALVSPHFLFRVELDPNPNDPKASRLLNDWELASRLSYFLWSSMPDDELLSLAEQGKLKSPPALEAQAVRMLKDPKTEALVRNFGDQWLTLRNLQLANPDRKKYPDWDDKLRADMQRETQLFFQDVMQTDRSILDFLDGRFTYLNERLAKHYGLAGVTGEQFRRVELPGDQRMGILTQGSILTVTSNPTRTSPVKRGKWVLEQILGTPPPIPPPNVPELKEGGDMLKGTLRQRMEQHRKDPGCATCHAKLDPLGFGLENFDAVGKWRDKDEGDLAIDSSGELPGGKKFNGPAELIGILKGQKDQFTNAFTSKLLTYALGRGLEFYDRCAVDEMVRTAAKKEYRFSVIVREIVRSAPFRMRRGDGGGV